MEFHKKIESWRRHLSVMLKEVYGIKLLSLAKVLYQYALWYREMEKSFPMEQILGMLYEGYEGENLFMVNVVWCNQHYK